MNYHVYKKLWSYLNHFLSISRVIACLFLLSACSEHKQIASDIEDYGERLESFTGIEIQQPTTIRSLHAPIKANLVATIEPVTINLRELYAFKQCALNQMIAQRNTSLGKMQLPSSRFIYEHALINEMSRCKALLIKEREDTKSKEAKDDINTLIAKLTHWQSLKQKQLPAVWSNFITQSNEIFLNLSQASDYIAAAPNDNFQATRQAWKFLASSNKRTKIVSGDLENHLKELGNARLLARIWRTQNYISAHLEAISPLLSTYLTNNQCTTRKQEKDIEIMQNIFRLFFADKIQPLAAELNRYHYQLAPLLENVIASGHLPKEFIDYVNSHIITGHNAYKLSMQNHIYLWQQIFARCN